MSPVWTYIKAGKGDESHFHYHTSEKKRQTMEVLGLRNCGQLRPLASRWLQSSGEQRAPWWWSGFPTEQWQTASLTAASSHVSAPKSSNGAKTNMHRESCCCMKCQTPYRPSNNTYIHWHALGSMSEHFSHVHWIWTHRIMPCFTRRRILCAAANSLKTTTCRAVFRSQRMLSWKTDSPYPPRIY